MRIYNPAWKLVCAARTISSWPGIDSYVSDNHARFLEECEHNYLEALWERSIDSPEDYWGGQREADAKFYFDSLPVSERVAQLRGCIITMQADIQFAESHGLPVPATRAQLERLKDELRRTQLVPLRFTPSEHELATWESEEL